MKTYRTHNTQLVNLNDGWKTSCKKGIVTIYDEANGYAFSITFGKKPEISVWNSSDNQNLGNEIHTFKVGEKPKIPSIEMADLLEGMNIAIAKKNKLPKYTVSDLPAYKRC